MNAQVEPGPLHEVRQPVGWRLPLLVAAVLGLGVLAGIIWMGPPHSETAAPPVPDKLPPLGPEAQAYIPQIEISALELSRWANFLGQEVIYVDLNLTNQGPRTILALDLTLEFFDLYGQVVWRETLRAIGARRPALGRPRAGPLGPGESRPFRAGFEDLPTSWNRGAPRVRVSGLLLQ